jgi:ABC-2 type transport system permease protein
MDRFHRADRRIHTGDSADGRPAYAVGLCVIALFWFRIPLAGSLMTLYAGLLLFLVSAVGVGLMISSLSTNQQQGLLGAFVFLVPAVILSGFATPIANMPQVVQWLTLANPLRYFMVLLRSVLLIGQLWPMAVIALINLTLAGWLFRRRTC